MVEVLPDNQILEESRRRCITTWHPDTCGCIVEYSWDRDTIDNPEQRVHTFHGHSRRCHDHEHLWNEDVYKTVLEENQRKNITLQHAADSTPLGVEEVRNRPSSPNIKIGQHRKMRPEVNHNFFFTHQGEETETGPNKPRILHLTFSEKLEEKHQRIIEARFPGLVKIH